MILPHYIRIRRNVKHIPHPPLSRRRHAGTRPFDYYQNFLTFDPRFATTIMTSDPRISIYLVLHSPVSVCSFHHTRPGCHFSNFNLHNCLVNRFLQTL